MNVARHFALLIISLLLALTPAVRAAAPVPSQLSDTEFWRLVSDFSEEGGGFISENFVSNELGYPYVMPTLIGRTRPGGAYIGVGPEQNFTYVAATHPGIAFIVDIRRQNLIEHLLYKAVFELSANRAEFLARLFARKPTGKVEAGANTVELFAAFDAVTQDEALFRTNLEAVRNLLVKQHGFGLSKDDEKTLEHVYAEFAKQGPDVRYFVTNPNLRSINTPIRIVTPPVEANPDTPAADPPQPQPAAAIPLGPLDFPSYAEVMKTADPNGKMWSFLATEESYQTVREMQRKNLIVPVVGDFAATKALRAVGGYLKEREATVSAFYVSNVEQYLTPLPKLISFYQNVGALPLDASSTFIRSAQTTGPQPGHAQSKVNSMQLALDAVLNDRVQSWFDIFQITFP